MPKILRSPAYRRKGMLVVTFDEADTGSTSGADACCNESPGPNAPLPGIYGMGGGRTGAVLLSPFITPGSWNNSAYNHYSLLRTIENTFHLKSLGYAAQARGFGYDVWGAADTRRCGAASDRGALDAWHQHCRWLRLNNERPPERLSPFYG